jgi:hypothetical protein
MFPDAKRLLATPEHHFLTFDGETALFLPMDRASYHRSAFLDRRVQALSEIPLKAPLAPLIEEAKKVPPVPVGWIFHVAHCGSTLLSRLIDSTGSNLVLREPPPLRQLGLAAAAGDRSEPWHDRLTLARAMAARRYDPALPTVIKANVPVNFMLDELGAGKADSPAVLLYLALEPYLVAALRTPQHRAWVERISAQLAPALARQHGLNPGAVPAEKAAALWLAQMLSFQSLQAAHPNARSLDATILFASPAATAMAAASQLGVIGADIEANVAALDGRYAKNLSEPFDQEAQQARTNEDRVRLSGEIATARRWIDRVAAEVGLSFTLDRPLIGAAAELLE